MTRASTSKLAADDDVCHWLSSAVLICQRHLTYLLYVKLRHKFPLLLHLTNIDDNVKFHMQTLIFFFFSCLLVVTFVSRSGIVWWPRQRGLGQCSLDSSWDEVAVRDSEWAENRQWPDRVSRKQPVVWQSEQGSKWESEHGHKNNSDWSWMWWAERRRCHSLFSNLGTAQRMFFRRPTKKN